MSDAFTTMEPTLISLSVIEEIDPNFTICIVIEHAPPIM
uniref:ATP-dependent Clp protease adaptor ClpS n=1 Tax=Ascaris lumbricoides TaxID=6252 RepID=A0A0M3I087_ASCLU